MLPSGSGKTNTQICLAILSRQQLYSPRPAIRGQYLIFALSELEKTTRNENIIKKIA